ncbi:hypothetical protein BJX70DRAFT_398140 [Aspergillus crustosus]
MSSDELHPEPEEYSAELYPEPEEPSNENQPSPVPPPKTCTVGTIKELCAELVNLRKEERDFVLTKDFWEENKDNLDDVCEGRTALGLATEQSASSELVRDIFKQLLDHKANINAKDDEERTAFSYVALLREKPGRSDGANSSESFYTLSPKPFSLGALHSRNYATWVEDCLYCLTKDDAGLINQPDASGRTPLSYAAEEGHRQMAEFIVKNSKSDDVFIADKKRRSPLSFAAERQNYDMIAFLVEKAESIDKRQLHRDVDDEGLTPLHRLHRVDRYEEGDYTKQEHNRESYDVWSHRVYHHNNSVDILLGYMGFDSPKDKSRFFGRENPVDPEVLQQLNQTVTGGKTLLSYAVLMDDDRLINSLCNRVKWGLRSDVANDDDQKTALMLALEGDKSDDGHSQTLKQLVPLANRRGALQAVIERGECELLRKLLVYLRQRTDEDKTLRTNLGLTVLDIYFQHATPDTAVPLLQTVIEELDPWQILNQKLKSGKWPLNEARNKGERSKELVDILLEEGANPKIWTQMRNWAWCRARPEQCLFTLSESKACASGFASYAFDYVSHAALEQAVAEDKRPYSCKQQSLAIHGGIQLINPSSHKREDSWNEKSSFRVPKDFTEFEISLDALKDIATYEEDERIKQPSWGVRWISKPDQQPLIYEGTLRKVWIPASLNDFLEEFLRELDNKWQRYCDDTEKHLNKHRGTAAKNDAIDESHINNLGHDFYYLSQLRDALQIQVRTVQQGLWKAFDSPSEDSKRLHNTLKEQKLYYNERLDGFEQVVNNLLQLEYTRHSMREAKTTRVITYISLIYLPLMFTSSLFGMNIDVLRDSPRWCWYLPFAAVSLVITFSSYFVYQYLEQRTNGRGRRAGGSVKGEKSV